MVQEGSDLVGKTYAFLYFIHKVGEDQRNLYRMESKIYSDHLDMFLIG